MKKVLLLGALATLGAISCTDANAINYSTARVTHVEDYLKANKPNPGTKKYKSLEKEAEAWKESQE